MSPVKIILMTCWTLSLLCSGQLVSQLGTTPNIRHIVVGRCYSYITLVNPGLRYDCDEMWRQFEDAVVRQPSCNVTVDYRSIVSAAPHAGPCHRSLFWSKTRRLMHSYAAALPQVWTLEDTLVGFTFNQLVWCGRERRDAGFDFGSCPSWSRCRNHPVYSLWRQASQSFAESACGNITVLLNGSIMDAFDRKSILGVELESLNPEQVDYVNIKVVTNLDGPFLESCSRGSVADLIHILESRGFRVTCADNDRTLMILQCVQDPKNPTCQRYVQSPDLADPPLSSHGCSVENHRVTGANHS